MCAAIENPAPKTKAGVFAMISNIDENARVPDGGLSDCPVIGQARLK